MLLARLRSRPVDPDAWQRFVHAYAPRVMQWCRHWGMQETDARDVVQTVLLRFWNQSPRFEYDAEGSFRAGCASWRIARGATSWSVSSSDGSCSAMRHRRWIRSRRGTT